MRLFLKWVLGGAAATVLVLGTILVVRGLDARSRGDLKPWHRIVPAGELRAAELDESFTLERYLAREAALFREVEERVVGHVPEAERTLTNRYFRESPLNPLNHTKNWNRTFELVPDEVRGGVLLVHGLTDAPYSMRRLAEIYRGLGFYALALRVPGHGTVPGALTASRWEDWAAAVRMGARHVRSRVGPGKPFHLVGYSNGGALAVDFAMDVLEGKPLPRPDRIVLVSPMIGVTPFAGLARTISLLGAFETFEASRWLDVLPEYVPYKYVSFPANAGAQTHDLTAELRAKVKRASEAGKLGALPPILTFVSLVDATVLTEATVRVLYDALPANGSELVVFDVNRHSELRPFLRTRDEQFLGELLPRKDRPFRLSVVTNAGPGTLEVVERLTPPGTEKETVRPLGLSWPRDVYSLSHVALPFPPDDPLFGGSPGAEAPYGFHLGTMHPRGERSVLAVPVDQLMRLTWNPFFFYLEERVRDGAQPAPR